MTESENFQLSSEEKQVLTKASQLYKKERDLEFKKLQYENKQRDINIEKARQSEEFKEWVKIQDKVIEEYRILLEIQKESYEVKDRIMEKYGIFHTHDYMIFQYPYQSKTMKRYHITRKEIAALDLTLNNTLMDEAKRRVKAELLAKSKETKPCYERRSEKYFDKHGLEEFLQHCLEMGR